MFLCARFHLAHMIYNCLLQKGLPGDDEMDYSHSNLCSDSYCTWKRFLRWSRSTVRNKCNLLSLFPATIVAFTRNAINAIWAHLINYRECGVFALAYLSMRSKSNFVRRAYILRLSLIYAHTRHLHLNTNVGERYIQGAGAKVKNALWGEKALKYAVLKLTLVRVVWNWNKSRDAPICYQSVPICKKCATNFCILKVMVNGKWKQTCEVDICKKHVVHTREARKKL